MPAPLSQNVNSSLLDTRSLTRTEIHSIFENAILFQQKFPVAKTAQIVACLFFEPSTRTRMSFQAAAYRLGHNVLTMELSTGSSLSKGETYIDTVLNVAAMKPDVMVIRYGHSPELDQFLPSLSMPVINAGSGLSAHPTQALLDAFTIQQEAGSVEGKKVLIVGDIRHSRVARSNFDVLSKLGAIVGVCGPESLLPKSGQELPPGARVFHDLDEAVSWCDVYMGLRIQLERHSAADLQLSSLEQYHQTFGLTGVRLKKLADHALILHPGPINHGVEFANEVMADKRCRVLQQVSNGVGIRGVLLARALDRTNRPSETKQ